MKALTIGQLRTLIADVDPDVEVVVATDGWYTNIEAVATPDEDAVTCLTLFPNIDSQNGNWDPRQLNTEPCELS